MTEKAFGRLAQRSAQSIGTIRVQLVDVGDGQRDTATYEAVVIYDDGSHSTIRGSLLPHLSPAQTMALRQFMASLRAKAEAEMLART